MNPLKICSARPGILAGIASCAILTLMVTCALPVSASPQAKKPKPGARKPVPVKPAPAKAAVVKLPSTSVTVPGTAVKIELVQVPSGSVTLAPANGKGAPKKVAVRSFWIARTETPWEVFDGFTMSGPPTERTDPLPAPDAVARPSKSYIPPDLGFGHSGYPVINVTWLSAEKFCLWLSKETGKKFRLPTEAEWEYACRAGSAVMPAGKALDALAWHAGNSGGTTHPVGKKQPNAWGLFDTLGNVGEWAMGQDGKPVLCGGTYDDKVAVLKSSRRVRETPAWQATDPQFPKSRWWLADGPFVGFRVVCEP